ncbi:MAG: sulfurtransferase [Methylomonas sp.]|nr:sulfurtransferase [Methylomonas sp.]PPD19939.1 MAG: sulfurtransferase [Methylomonas sp.]PPD25484.1 MAG: sulfurtransferase [Methylomonas sp.]PPD36184.1 MAG: sulfurtransferase [Methylomonas sp.]PPD39724.1 MAG: sulfurtransferase [Methylomonas sp.]
MAFNTLVSAATLADHVADPDWVIFDCRFSLNDSGAGARAYRQAHIAGARYADLNQDLSSPVKSYTGRHPLPDFGQLSRKLGDWGVNGRTQVVVYDDADGAFAGRLWWLLRCMGHDTVAVLDGGIVHWRKLGLPLTTVLPKIEAAQFRCYLDDRQWLTARTVEDGLARRRIRLIDARAAERYQGLQETIDPVAGHVPNAVNRPFQRNLNASGLFKPVADLRAEFQMLLGGQAPDHVVHMCGSGVTACHNVLAMTVAGLAGSRLYAGSWSEWITDKNRGVARGTRAA